MKKPISFTDARKAAKKAAGQVIAAGFKPSKTSRDSKPRSDEESQALARAVYSAVKKSEQDGTLVKHQTRKGYVMSWKAAEKK